MQISGEASFCFGHRGTNVRLRNSSRKLTLFSPFLAHLLHLDSDNLISIC